MIIIKNKIHIEQGPNIYWTRVDILSDGKDRESFIFAGISGEQLNEFCKLQHGKELTDEQINDWVKFIEKKWLDFGSKIFEKKIHYDSCENNGVLTFLKSLTKNN